MTRAWVISDTFVDTSSHHPSRASGMVEYDAEIAAAQGSWNGFELKFGLWLNKVNCLDTTLAKMKQEPNWLVIDKALELTDTLGSLTNAEINAISSYLQGQGFDVQDFRAKLGGTVAQIKAKTIGQLLNWFAGQFNVPRWDDATQAFIYDGPAVVCPPLSDLTGI